MKANEFIREHGLEKAKELVKTSPLDKREKPKDMIYIPNDTFIYKSTPLDICVDVVRLTILIESHDLVYEHGSLRQAKKYAESEYTAPEIREMLLKAITDVESCQ